MLRTTIENPLPQMILKILLALLDSNSFLWSRELYNWWRHAAGSNVFRQNLAPALWAISYRKIRACVSASVFFLGVNLSGSECSHSMDNEGRVSRWVWVIEFEWESWDIKAACKVGHVQVMCATQVIFSYRTQRYCQNARCSDIWDTINPTDGRGHRVD